MPYANEIKNLLPRNVRALFSQLNSPIKIQDYLDELPINFETSGDTCLSPLQVIEQQTAHCFEGAVFAAAVLAYHGHEPLLMDFATAYDDEDHCVALFRKNDHWGAISKTNHIVLKYRDPIYRTKRELAMSFAHEYYMYDGRKSLRAFSAAFDLSQYPPEKWITAGESVLALDWLYAPIARSRYFPLAPDKNLRGLRRASKLEQAALELAHFPDPRTKKRG